MDYFIDILLIAGDSIPIVGLLFKTGAKDLGMDAFYWNHSLVLKK